MVVHCCYYISLLLGWWNIVQGGDPLYAGVNPRWDCGGHIWPNWVQFFAKYTWLTRLLEEKNYFGTQNSFSGRWGGIFSRPRSFFGNWGFFRKLRILGVGDEEEDEGDWTQTKFRIYHFHLSLSNSGNEGKTDAVFIKNMKIICLIHSLTTALS